jgi:hypothetical protein
VFARPEKAIIMLGALLLCNALAGRVSGQSAASPQNIFHVKYVTEGTVYVDAGRNAGLKEGMILSVVRLASDGEETEALRFRSAPGIAELRVIAVADTSAVCEIVNAKSDVQPKDIAYLSPQSIEVRTEEQNTEDAKNYPVTVSFTEGDPLDEEVRETKVPRVMSPPIENQMRGRIGFDYGGISQSGGLTSNQMGVVVRADMRRIGGTYWNFSGYWRGRLTSQGSGTSVAPITLTDLINRTYHLGFYYDNPHSLYTAGIGRLYLPWAPSLNTIDGAYVGRKLTRHLTTGIFAGSTPDPTSWSYNPNQHIAGTFVNYEAGDFDHFRWISTAGLAMTSIGWHLAREFSFFENTLSYGRKISAYNSMQADAARTTPNGETYNTGITQSFTTIRYQPVKRITFNLNHNYFRNLPTFDPNLIGTGLLDQYLFQGLSGGIRVEMPWKTTLYTTIGRSQTSTDTSQSWNQLYGISFGDLFKTGFRLDAHYSKFSSSFGSGNYKSISVTKDLRENLRFEVQGGWQFFLSPLTSNTNSMFVTGLVDWTLGPRYFMEAGFTWNTGTSLNYEQWTVTFGYRFGGFRTR